MSKSCLKYLTLALVGCWASLALGADQAIQLPTRGVLRMKPNQTLAFSIPDDAASQGEAYLSLQARIDAADFKNGSAPAITLQVNGLPLTIGQLKNKPWFYVHNSESHLNWYDDQRGRWRLVYDPWDSDKLPDPQALTYVFSLKGLLKTHDNRFVIHNPFSSVPGAAVEVRNVQVLHNSDFPRSPLLKQPIPLQYSQGFARFRQKANSLNAGLNVKLAAPAEMPHDAGHVRPQQDFRQDYRVSLNDAGELSIQCGQDRYKVGSWFGTPGAGWVHLSQADRPAGAWRIARTGDDALRLSSPQVTIDRTLERQPSHITIRDHVVNRTRQDLPLAFLNTLDAVDPGAIREFRISGLLQRRFWANQHAGKIFAATPIVYLRKRTGMALVAQDSVYRNQASVITWDATVAVGSDLFYLPPGGDYTFVWKLYPSADGDYFEVINALRSDWNLFQEIPALFGFVYPHGKDKSIIHSPDKAAAFFDATGIGVAGVSPSEMNGKQRRSLYGNETPERLRRGAQAFAAPTRDTARQVRSDVKFVMYTDVHLVNTAGDAARLTQFGQSVMRDPWGRPYPYRAGWLYNVLPLPGSLSWQRVFQMMNVYLDECHFDGLFLDEWSHSNALISYSNEDGHSALLDEHLRIQQKIGFVPLLLRDFYPAYVKQARARGAILFANGFDASLEAAQLPVIHFAEPTAPDDYKLAAAQIGRTPLSLNLKRTKGVWHDVHTFLKQGVLACCYASRMYGDHLLKKVYPITVREVHPGYVIGKSKIVTLRSGRYTFGRSQPLEAYIYGGDKGLLQRRVTGVMKGSVAEIDLYLKADNREVAVIVEAASER